MKNIIDTADSFWIENTTAKAARRSRRATRIARKREIRGFGGESVN